MRYLLAAAFLFAGLTGRAQVFAVEGGLDALRQNLPLVDQQPDLGVAGAVSGYLQVSDLRSYYGLMLAAHSGATESEFGEPGTGPQSASGGTQWQASAMAGWRAFPFDLEGDCECPTWKEENWLRKAFFVEAALGFGRQGWNSNDPAVSPQRRNGVAYLARVGLSHRLARSVDVFGAVGLHGLIGEDGAFGRHQAAARPTLGIAYRL